jgi:hypothetical protein
MATRCLIIRFHNSNNNNNNSNVQLEIILNNEDIVLESFINIFGMTCMYFSKKLAIPKNN